MTARTKLLNYLPSWPDGVTIIDAAPMLRACDTTLYAAARKLRDEGFVAIGTIGPNSQMIVCLKQFEPAMLARIKQERDARREECRRVKLATNERCRNAARLRAMQSGDTQERDEAPMVQRIVPASKAKPLVKRGPASVFELAELA